MKAAVDQQLTQLNSCKVTTCDTAQISLNHVTHEWGMATAQTVLEDHDRARHSTFELNLHMHNTIFATIRRLFFYADTAVVI